MEKRQAGHLRDLQCGAPLKHIHPVINPPLAPSVTFTLTQTLPLNKSSLLLMRDQEHWKKARRKGKEGAI